MTHATKRKRRTRLDPESRRAQIVEHTARLVSSEGLSAVSMGRIAKETGVSKALVYTYFSSPVDVLQAVVKRDMERIQAAQAEAAMSADTFPQLVRNTTHVALTEARHWGPLLQQLMRDPELARAIDPVRARERQNVDYLTKRISDAFEISRNDAKRLTRIALGLTIAAAEMLQDSGADAELVEDLTVSMIESAVRSGAAHIRSKDNARGSPSRGQRRSRGDKP